MAGDWYLYVIRAGDGSLYAGISTDVKRRVAEHAAGGAKASKYLRSRPPLKLVYRARIGSRGLALRAEAGLKRLPKGGKEAIVKKRPRPKQLLRLLDL